MTSLTQKSKYALKALFYLSRHYQPDQGVQTPVLIAELAEAEHIPRKFLEVILLELKHATLLQSRKGKGGGYWLSKKPQDIYLGHVIRIFEGPIAPIACVSKRHFEACQDCDDIDYCQVRYVMLKVKLAVLDILDKTSLADVLNADDLPIML
ncbi:MAG: Rrf2 family transcriptional regulator [Deinococcales bacterium]